MNKMDDTTMDQLLSTDDQAEPTPEHRAWMNAEIRKTLAKVEAGEMTYHSLEDVMREFGFDAR